MKISSSKNPPKAPHNLLINQNTNPILMPDPEIIPITEPQKWTIRQRLLAVMEGRKPDRIPLISRLDFWYNGLKYQGKLPSGYSGLSLREVHRKTGFGQEEWSFPCALRLRGAQLVI